MKIAVVAANGKAGRLITDELIARGHDVTAVVRTENRSNAPHAILRDILDITAEDLAGFEAVVDAFGAFTPEALHLHSASASHLADLVATTGARLCIVGGAGSLLVDEDGTRLLDSPGFPEEFRPLASAQADEVALLKTREDAAWTFVSPAAVFLADGERRGSYVLGDNRFTVGEDGTSALSYADYAIAIADLVEDGGHVREHLSVRWA